KNFVRVVNRGMCPNRLGNRNCLYTALMRNQISYLRNRTSTLRLSTRHEITSLLSFASLGYGPRADENDFFAKAVNPYGNSRLQQSQFHLAGNRTLHTAALNPIRPPLCHWEICPGGKCCQEFPLLEKERQNFLRVINKSCTI
ncbi:Hypothetical predicted protein, partial [Olea europaea subsp. europaea]